MIFYFSGTGNSKYIADKLSICLDEKTVNIAKAYKEKNYSYDCTDDNKIGFVFPTYGWSIPYVVKDFIESLEFKNVPEDIYYFAVNNCGASEGRSLYDLSMLLETKGIKLDYARTLILPDNYIIMFNPLDDEEKKRIFKAANIKLANIINNILRNKKSVQIKKGILLYPYKLVNKFFTKFLNGTSKFRTTDDCTGCGFCSQICSTSTINMKEGKPVWVEDSCVHCLACLNRCPSSAIEYGSKTVDKERYVNPYVDFDYVDEGNAFVEEEPEIEFTHNYTVNEILSENITVDDESSAEVTKSVEKDNEGNNE